MKLTVWLIYLNSSLNFTVDESCGKCTPCRIGNKRLLEILTKICDGKGTEEDLVDLKDLALTS